MKPRIYWRRGQDEYIFVRSNPSIYRNLHITHKVGAALDASNSNTLGTTGLGVDVARVSIASNNLGDRDRIMTTLFAEHRFQLLDNALDITPGLALTNYTDFNGFPWSRHRVLLVTVHDYMLMQVIPTAFPPLPICITATPLPWGMKI